MATHIDLNTLDETPGPTASVDPTAGVQAVLPGDGQQEEEWSYRGWRPWGWSGWWQPWDAHSYGQGGTYAVVTNVTQAPASSGVTSSGVQTEPGTDPWQRVDPWTSSAAAGAAADSTDGRQSVDWQPGAWRGWDRSDQACGRSDWSQGDWSTYGSKPDYSDPPSWPGWAHRRLWVQAIRRWDKHTDVPMHKRGEKVLRSLGWELQVDFEHLEDEVICSAAYLDAIIAVMNNKAGVREDDERRRAYRQAITDNQRRKDETLAQFAVRRMRDFRSAATFGVQVPGALQAMLMREGAGLSDQNQQNLTALVQGREDDPDAIARALSRMDVRADRLTAYADGAHVEHSYMVEEPEDASDDEETLEDEQVLKELEPLELNEDQVLEVFAVLEQRRRSWKENKLFKADMKKDRGSFVKDGGKSFPRGQFGGVPGADRGKPRKAMNREQLKKISKCRLCHKKGHWAEDCHLRKKASPTAFTYGNDGGNVVQSAFTFLTIRDLRAAIGSVLGPSNQSDGWAFLSLTGGEAVLDIGATQDLIGVKALEELTQTLKSVGLQPVRVDKPVITPAGIGGSAKALYVVLLPISPGGAPGVLEMTVLEGNIPPLLSVGFLDFLKASMDLENNTISLKTLGLELSMKRLSSGHRTIPLVQWQGGHFPVPDSVLRKYGLPEGAFNLSCDDSCAYTNQAADQASVLINVEGVENQGISNEPNDESKDFIFSRDLDADQDSLRGLQQVHRSFAVESCGDVAHTCLSAVHESIAFESCSDVTHACLPVSHETTGSWHGIKFEHQRHQGHDRYEMDVGLESFGMSHGRIQDLSAQPSRKTHTHT